MEGGKQFVLLTTTAQLSYIFIKVRLEVPSNVSTPLSPAASYTAYEGEGLALVFAFE